MSKEYTFHAVFEEPEVTVEADDWDEAQEKASEQLHREYRSHRCPGILQVNESPRN